MKSSAVFRLMTRSQGYENRHGRTVASDHGRYSASPYATVLPAAVAGVGLHVDMTVMFSSSSYFLHGLINQEVVQQQ